MFGYACNHTQELMPMPIALAHRITNRLAEVRRQRLVDWLRPDSKSQVTVEFDGPKPVRIHTVVLSTQHHPDVNQRRSGQVVPNVIQPCLPPELVNGEIKYYVNPTGKFVVGGPHGDCGLTGRKIIVDTYGGWARHGGGAFSGKDPTKVDRSATYMARHVAKNLVAAGLADRCEVQLAYAIGVSHPISVLVDTDGTGRIEDERLCEIVRELFPLTPRGIIEYLELRRPIYLATAAAVTSAAASRPSPGRARLGQRASRSRRLAPQPAQSSAMTTTTSVELGIGGSVPSTERAVRLLLRSALLAWVAMLGAWRAF